MPKAAAASAQGSQPFQARLSSTNAERRPSPSTTQWPERWRAGWDDNLTAGRHRRPGGLEFDLPIARWKGFGGVNQRATKWSFEDLHLGRGPRRRDAATSGLFMTVHVPPRGTPSTPRRRSRPSTTSEGGATGLNIVCGWNPADSPMFGSRAPTQNRLYGPRRRVDRDHRARLRLVQPFDYAGRFYEPEGRW